MIPALVEQFNQINRDFYDRFAVTFAESRSLEQPGLRRLVDEIPAGARVLDIGCGHGRLAHLLDRHRPGVSYLGLDSSSVLIDLAERGCAGLANVATDFRVVDLLEPRWSSAIAGRHFDAILALAVLHHIPGYDNRLSILCTLRERLAVGGRMVVSAWQFTTNERMRRKIVSWDRVDLDPAGLEPGDYLLDWKRGGLGYRYCHLIDLGELTRLAAESGCRLLEHYRSDGKEGDLSLFGVLAAADQ